MDHGGLDDLTILGQSAALRAMVRALVRDEATADDVVQDTWLTAMRKPLPDPEPGGWLRGIARNLARTVRRTDLRRARRESEVARPDSAPSAADDAAKLERLRELLGIVSTLREPIRQTVILRYLDGLMPRDIADRLGIPVATVKARLHTGLGLLREALDARHGGDRSSWHAAFAPLLPEITAAGAAAASVTVPLLVTGGIAMKATAGVLAGVVIVALLVWFNRPVADARDSEVPSLPAPSAGEAANASSAARSEPRIQPKPFAPESEEAGASKPAADEMRVLVVAKNGGAPVAGARVRMWDDKALDWSFLHRVWLLRSDLRTNPPGGDPIERTSDRTGSATFPKISAPKFIAETANLWGMNFRRSDGGEARIEVEEDLNLTVRVIDSADSPVGGVPVRLTRFSSSVPPIDFAYGTTEPDGSFVASHLQLNGQLLDLRQSQALTVRLGATFEEAGRGVAFDPVRLPKEPITLRLPPSARMTVSVADSNGAPFLGSAYVGLRVREPPREIPLGAYVEPDPDDWRKRGFWQPLKGGNAVFPFVGLGLELTVRVFAIDQEHELATTEVAGPVVAGEDLHRTIEVGARVPVVIARLVDESGRPLSGRPVSIGLSRWWERDLSTTDTLSATCDADGRIRVGVSRVSWRLGTSPFGFRSALKDESGSWREAVATKDLDPALLRSKDVDLGEIVMRIMPILVGGSVRDDRGSAVSGATVLVELRRAGDSKEPWQLLGWHQANTAEDGSFRITTPTADGDLRLSAGKEGYGLSETVPFTRGQSDVSIVVPRSASLEGSVVLPEGVLARDIGLVMTGSCVPAVADRLSVGKRSIEPKPDGSFIVKYLRGGKGSLVVTPRGRLVGRRMVLAQVDGIDVADGGVARDPRVQTIDLRERIQLRRVAVVDSDGKPIDGAEIAFRPEGLPLGDGDAGSVTGLDGRASILTGLEPVSVTIFKEGWIERSLVLAERDVRIVLERGVTLEVAVSSDGPLPTWPENLRIELQRDEMRQPEEGAALQQWWERAAALADGSGMATVKAPFTGAGRLRMVVNREGTIYEAGVLPVEIRAGNATQRIAWRIAADAIRRR